MRPLPLFPRVWIHRAASRIRCAILRPSLTPRGESNDMWRRAIGHPVVGIPLKSAQSACVAEARARNVSMSERMGYDFLLPESYGAALERT